MTEISAPKFTIFSDHTDPAGADLFSFKSRLSPIFDVLRHKKTAAPLSMAVYGSSGTGKTTALEWLEHRLEPWNAMPEIERNGHPSVLPVWFRPHPADDPDSVLRQLIFAITQSDDPTDLNGWLDARTDPARIVVFIDGLDLCGAATVMALLDAVGRWNLLFVVALNGAVIRRLVQQNFAEHGYGEQESRAFLAKIFPLECHVEPSPAQIRRFYIEQVTLLNRRTGNLYGQGLKPDHRVCINEAILQLAGTNPRTVKHLLNRVMMRGAAMGEPLRFAQAVQRDLLRSWLASSSLDESILQREAVRNWFAAISEEAVKETAAFDWIARKQEEQDEGDEDVGRGSWNNVPVDTRLDPPEGLAFKMIPEWLWNLLKIPFGVDVADSAPQLVELVPVVDPMDVLVSALSNESVESSGPVESIKEPSILSAASPEMKRVLASALETTVSDLTDELLKDLDTLDLSGARLSPEDYSIIGKMESLKQLELYNSPVDCLDWIEGLTGLKVLNLSCSKVVELAPLSSLSTLETLDLSYTMVSDLSPLSGLTSLTWLVLYGTPVKSIEAIRELGNLERLNLSRTHITPDELEHLEKLTSLKNLFLRDTAIRQKNVPRLKQSIGFDLEVEI